MPLPRFVQQLARNYLQNAHTRILRGFSSFLGGRDRLGGLEGASVLRVAQRVALGGTNAKITTYRTRDRDVVTT